MGFKQDLFEHFGRIGQALSSGKRLELLEFLAQGERSVEALGTAAGLSTANASHHLQQLRRAGLVASRKEGLKVYYRLSGDEVIELLASLRAVGERYLAEVDRLVEKVLGTKDPLEPLTREQFLERLRQGTVTVLDVRPAEEYGAGHLPGAINLPLTEIEKRLATLDPDREFVAYCRGPYCVLAFEAVALLRSRGLNARRLEDGYPEWRAAGLPIAASASEPGSARDAGIGGSPRN